MKKGRLVCLIGFIFVLSGCDLIFIESGPESEPDYGKISVHLTDAPFPFDIVDQANVTITRVDIKPGSDSLDEGYITIFEDTATFNLIDLRNGVVASLLEAEVPVGKYSSIRLYTIDANIVLSDERKFDVKVPSGEQTGIKVKLDPAIEVVTALSSDVLLDFDVSKSFVITGNSKDISKIKGFIFKPVVRAVNYTTSGTIAGYVTNPGLTVLENMEVWIETSDTVYMSTYTNQEGIYGMIGVPAGYYTMFATGEGYDTARSDIIEVIEANRYMKSFTLNPL